MTLEIELGKNRYVTYEPIYLNIYLHNTSNANVNTNGLFLHCDFLKILLTNGSGKLIENNQPIPDCKRMTLSLGPDRSEYTWYNLTMAYGTGSPMPLPTKKFLEPDSFSVQASFETGSSVVYSNILKFKINEPEGRDREAAFMLARAADLGAKNKSGEAMGLLDSLRAKYPRTVYLPLTFLTQVEILSTFLKDERKSYEVAKALIDDFPGTEYALSALSNILTHIARVDKDVMIRHEILASVVQKYSGTKVGMWAAKVLSREHGK